MKRGFYLEGDFVRYPDKKDAITSAISLANALRRTVRVIDHKGRLVLQVEVKP